MFSRKKKPLQTSEELNYIISNLPDLIVRLNREKVITFINPASVIFLGRAPEDLLGLNFYRVFNHSDKPVIPEAILEKVFVDHNAEILESYFTSDDGHQMHIEIRILPDPVPGNKEEHIILMIRDITIKKEAERKLILAKQHAEESDRLKSAFLANMSHEIRTPLNAIVGFSQIILEDDLETEERSRYFEYIYQNSNQLIGLVNDIIDISKLESNQLIIRSSPTNLNQILQEVQELAENEKKIRSKSHLLIIQEKEFENDQALVVTDPYRLRQILTNLLVNAVKFTPKGYIQFGYRLKEAEQILFFCRDTGIGIPPEKHEEVFQYFRQLENTLTRGSAGTGLGLAICKNLVELMGGNICLQSEPSKGTTFFFSLPYVKANLGGLPE